MFIATCGIGHFLEYVVFHTPVYNLIGVWKLVTAVSSWATIGVVLYFRKDVLSLRTNDEFMAIDRERERAAEEVRLVNENLEEMIQKRTVELEDVNRRLLDADRQKNEFLAMLSHELRNPLAPIATSLAIINESTDPVAVGDAKAVMSRQTRHLVKLVDALLDTQRIRLGKFNLEKSAFTFQDAIKTAHEVAAAGKMRPDFRTFIDVPKDDVWFYGDRDRVVQSFVNLFTNAMNFSRPAGSLVVRLELLQDVVIVIFRDDGIGIPEELLPVVFDPFVQGEQGIDRPNGGLGIGLSLVKYVVEAHGGTVRITSPGKDAGVTACVTFPAAHAPSRKDPAATAHTGVRILVVDDNVDAATSLSWLLRLDGYDVVGVAHTGIDAVVAARRTNPDVILLDLGLPGMNGHEVCKTVRAAGMDCMIIAVTGWGADEDRRQSKEAGFDNHLVKPVDPATLRAAIRK